jgi:hypothetical protein
MEFKGVWNAATNSPTLVNGTGNAGDVWLCNVAGTVNFGAGPIVFAVGDYAVYTGTEWARSSGATGTVTSVGVSRDGNALTITGSPVTSSGTINLGFSGDNTQYINGAGNLTTFPTVINSIGLTMPAAFGVSNSPLTANGTIGVTALGFPSQYIRGDGTLADFPTSGGGGSSVSYYLNGGTSQGTIGGTTYYEMSKIANTGTMVDFSKTGDGFITAFLTDANDPALLQIPAGNWDFEIYASMSSNGGTPELYAELYKYDGTTFTLIATSSHEILYDGVNLNLYSFATAVPETVLTVTDRLAIKLYATNSGGKTTTVHTQNGHLCQVITTFTTGLTALNGLTSQVQYFATGTSGSDFNIVSSVATHTFNIPSASATARGLITTGTQTIAGAKTITGTTTFTGGPILSDTNLTYANSGFTLVLQSPTLSVNRTVTLPNGTGTLALTSDISYPVTSVFGRTGAVVATSGDYTTAQVTESGNLYFTDARARTAISLTTTGSTGASTYNNTTGVLNIPNYADQYVGTVTSVGLSAPTGFSVSGSPVTSSGTLALSFASGYSLPTNVKQSNWDDAYTWVAAFPTQTGNTGKFLTTDGSSLSWVANPLGTVTSVDMSVPTGLTVSGNPITTSGTLAVTLTAGYSIPTTANQSTWTTAYNRSLTSAAVTGTTTKTLTLNQQDGGTITASWTDINTDAVTSVFGRTGAVVATEGDYTLTQLGDVTITSPSSGQVLKYNGTAWINDTDANTGTVTSVAMTVPTGLSIAGSPITSSGTLAVTFAAGYSIPTNASQTTWDTAYTNRITSLTTTGTSGAATLISNVLNIPQYQSVLTNPVTGTGTLNKVAKFSATGSTITDSSIFDNGTFVGINSVTSVSSDFRLQVAGGIYAATSSANTVLDITNTNLTTGYGVYIQAGGNSVGRYSLLVRNAANSDLLKVLPSGRTLINNATDDTTSALQVSGVARFTSNIILGNGASEQIQSANSYIEIYNGSTGDMTFFSGFGTGAIKFCTANNTTPKVTISYTGATTFTSTITASNFTGSSSGTNTGDQTLAGLGGVPTSRTLTINGVGYDLSADRSWTITAGVSGSGTENKIPKWNNAGGTTIGDSILRSTTFVDAISAGGALGYQDIYFVGRYLQDETTYRGVAIGYQSTAQRGIIYAESAGATSSLGFATYDATTTTWAQRVYITSSGLFVLGTSSTAYNFVIGNSNSLTGLYATDGGGLTKDFLLSTGGSVGSGAIRIFANGNAQVAASNLADQGYKLYVDGLGYYSNDLDARSNGTSLWWGGSAARYGQLNWNTNETIIAATTGNKLTFRTNGVTSAENRLIITTGGKVNINNSTNTDFQLYVDAGGLTSGNSKSVAAFRTGTNFYFDIIQSWNTSPAGQSLLGTLLKSTDDLAISTLGVERLRIDTGGDMCFYGTAITSATRAVFRNSSSALTFFAGDAGSSTKEIQWYVTNGTTQFLAMQLRTTGYLYLPKARIIGDTDIAYMDLYNPNVGNVRIVNTSASASFGRIELYTNNTLRVTVQTNGDTNFTNSIIAGGDVTAYSDISVKENIRPIENVLTRINNSRGVLYDRIDTKTKNNIGFIAQELEKEFPELITTNLDGTKGVKYQNAVAVLFEAIKEQQKQINQLKNIN